MITEVTPDPKTDTRAARPRSLRIAFYASGVLWFGFHGPLRRMTAGMSPGLDAVLDVIPSFFAAIYATVAVYIGALHRRKPRPLRATAYGAAFVAATEIIQLFGVPNYTFDPTDIAAGILGAVAVVPLMWWHKPRR